MAQELSVVVDRVQLKPVIDKDGRSVEAVVVLSFPLDSDAVKWLGVRVGSPIDLILDDPQGELALETAR
jgi:hypothetical protein